MTGARPGELLNLNWADVNRQWKGMAIRDKVEVERVIPLTPYVASLLQGLTKAGARVFSTARAAKIGKGNPTKTGDDAGELNVARKAGPIASLQKQHALACKAAGIEGLTMHGLRRSFAGLTEWLEVPAGVVAQIMGHKLSATAEEHYKVWPIELLRMHHEKVEAWMLERAGVRFKPSEGAPLRVLA